MKNFIYLAVIAAVLSSCTKSSTTTAVTATSLLTAKTWKSSSFNEGGAPLSSWCTLNSTHSYTADGNGVFVQGDNLGACSGPSIGDAFYFKWKLIDNDSKIVYSLYEPGWNDTASIKELTSTSLKLNYTVNGTETWEEDFTPK